MKRLLITVLAAVFLLSACSGAPRAEPQQTPSAAQETAPSPSPSLTLVPTPKPTPEPTPRPLLDPSVTDYRIDSSLFCVPAEKGTLETVEYETKDYTGSGDTVTKRMCVYLPYVYSEDEQYSVLFLMHIMSCDERFWFSEHEYVPEDESCSSLYIPYLIDNMIERGMCRPLIVVSLCGYINEDAKYQRNSDRDFTQFSSEFRNDILPYMCAHYSVYGDRDHIGFMGASFGAYLTYRSVFGPCFDLVSNIGLTGGGTVDPGWLREKWAGAGAQDMRAKYVFIGEGDADDRGPVELGYMYLAGNTDLFDESNLKFTLYRQTGHDFREWDNTLYNCLQLFFR